MSGSPKIVAIDALGQHGVAAPGNVFMLLEMPRDWAMCREIGGDVDLCDPGFEAEVTFALAQAGIGKAAAAGIDELREQRDRAREALRRIADTSVGSGASQYPWIFAEQILSGASIEWAEETAAEGYP